MSCIINSIEEWQQIRQKLQDSIGFVATMGNLHAGHASLLARSKQENNKTVLSIFVNPNQFDELQDYQQYPRTLSDDLALADELNVDYVFLPEKQVLYPDDYIYQIHENCLSKLFCGQHRPGHFTGMLTVVLKLLLLIKPNRAYFGEKDFQQLELIRGMVKAFFIDTDIIGCPIVRDVNGVALSSRNNLLSKEDYNLVKNFPYLLKNGHDNESITAELAGLGFSVDYIAEHKGRRLGAVRLRTVRLIDNVEL